MLLTSSTKKRSSKKVGETLSKSLYHYGVKGMKWGVRKKGNSDSDNLANSLKKHTEDVAKFETNTYVGDKKLQKDVVKSKSQYEGLKQLLQKKYDSIDAKSNVDYEKGKAHVQAILKKGKDTYVSEIDADFDPLTEDYLRSLFNILY